VRNEPGGLPKPIQHFKSEAEKLLPKLEEKRDAVVVPLLFSIRRLISKPSVDELYDALSSIGEQPKVDVILFSYGGDPDQAYIIGSMLQDFTKERLTIIVPRIAKSAATLIACAGDEVGMGPASELGPVDLTIEIEGKYVSVMSIMELVEMIKMGSFGDLGTKVLEKIPILELGDYSRLSRHTPRLLEKLLTRRMFKDEPERARAIAEELCKSYESHSAAIVLTDLKDKLKLTNISPDTWSLIWSLHRLWINTIINYEDRFPGDARFEEINIRVGKGVVFCTKLIEEK
jgi:hypothetical protein